MTGVTWVWTNRGFKWPFPCSFSIIYASLASHPLVHIHNSCLFEKQRKEKFIYSVFSVFACAHIIWRTSSPHKTRIMYVHNRIIESVLFVQQKFMLFVLFKLTWFSFHSHCFTRQQMKWTKMKWRIKNDVERNITSFVIYNHRCYACIAFIMDEAVYESTVDNELMSH